VLACFKLQIIVHSITVPFNEAGICAIRRKIQEGDLLDPLQPYETPLTWTADHVLTRLKWAFETLNRIRVRVGPKGFKSNWPQYVYDFADRVAQEEAPLGAEASEAEHARLNSASNTKITLPPSARDIDLMEECFDWPLHHLPKSKKPQIIGWAWATVNGNTAHRFRIQQVYLEAGQIVSGLRAAKVVVR
jgi:hypothetical protein